MLGVLMRRMMMLIERKSMISGKTTYRDLDITQEQLDQWEEGAFIQDVFPYLSISDREFIMTGITEDEWDTLMEEDHE